MQKISEFEVKNSPKFAPFLGIHLASCKFGAEEDPEMTAVLKSCAVVDFSSCKNLR